MTIYFTFPFLITWVQKSLTPVSSPYLIKELMNFRSILYLICNIFKAKPRCVITCSLLSVTHMKFDMVKSEEGTSNWLYKINQNEK